MPARANSPILIASQCQLTDFESRPEPILPVFKSFSQIHKLFALNDKEFLIQYKIKGTVNKILNICRTLS
jgi:hypothetical protein